MKTKELESYYFGLKEFQKLREKHFTKIKDLLDVKEFFNNASLSDEQLIDKQIMMHEKIFSYISNNKRIRRDFYNAYGIITIDSLCELVFQSIVADELIKTGKELNIFFDVESVIYFDGEYPMNIWHWKNEQHSLKDYCKEFCRWYDSFDECSEEDIFGLEFVNEKK